jgi:hypothetical protein
MPNGPLTHYLKNSWTVCYFDKVVFSCYPFGTLGFKHTSITYYFASIIDYFAQEINKLISVLYYFTSITYYILPILLNKSSLTNFGAQVRNFST